MTPPRAAYDAARARTLTACTALAYGLITYDDIIYEAAVSLDGEGYNLTDMGQRIEQRLRFTIAKCLLADRPRRGATVYYEERAYEIELVGGDHAGDAGWSATAFRTPGADPV